MKKFLKVFYIVFFILALVSSKASAAPTYVDVFSIENEEGHVHGLTFSSDGTVVYIVGHGADRVYQYPLDTAWDISSITSGSSGSLLVRSNGGDPRDIKFNTNGTKLFVLDRVVSRIYECH